MSAHLNVPSRRSFRLSAGEYSLGRAKHISLSQNRSEIRERGISVAVCMGGIWEKRILLRAEFIRLSTLRLCPMYYACKVILEEVGVSEKI